MDEVRVSAILLKAETDRAVTLKLEPKQYEILKELAKQKKWKEGSVVGVMFEEWSDDRSDEAFNLFHKLRDRLADRGDMHGTSEKEELKQRLKLEYGPPPKVISLDGKEYTELKSTKDYSRKEMTALIEGVIEMCEEYGADIGDLI